MEYADKLQELHNKLQIVKKWDKRIKRLGTTRAKFCKRHGYNEGQFSRWVRGTTAPTWDSINRIEHTLEFMEGLDKEEVKKWMDGRL